MASFDGFTPNDFQDTIQGTSWRRRDGIGGVLASKLQENTDRPFRSWGVRRRTELFIAPPDHFRGPLNAKNGLPRCKLRVATSSSELLYGFYIEKGYLDPAAADDDNQIMDSSWDWHHFAAALRGQPARELHHLVKERLEQAAKRLTPQHRQEPAHVPGLRHMLRLFHASELSKVLVASQLFQCQPHRGMA